MVLKQYLIPGGTTLTDHCHKGGRQVPMPQHLLMHLHLNEPLPSVDSTIRGVTCFAHGAGR